MIFKFNYHGPANIFKLSTSERIMFFIKLQYSKFCFLTFSSRSVLSVTQRLQILLLLLSHNSKIGCNFDRLIISTMTFASEYININIDNYSSTTFSTRFKRRYLLPILSLNYNLFFGSGELTTKIRVPL